MADRPHVLSIIAESVTVHHKRGLQKGQMAFNKRNAMERAPRKRKMKVKSDIEEVEFIEDSRKASLIRYNGESYTLDQFIELRKKEEERLKEVNDMINNTQPTLFDK